MKLIDDWKQAHKFLTVQLAALLTLLSLAYDYLPAIREALPEGWTKYAFPLILVARLLHQKSLSESKGG